MAGVARLREGRGGVDGVSPTKNVSGVEELCVRHSLQQSKKHTDINIHTDNARIACSLVWSAAEQQSTER